MLVFHVYYKIILNVCYVSFLLGFSIIWKGLVYNAYDINDLFHTIKRLIVNKGASSY